MLASPAAIRLSESSSGVAWVVDGAKIGRSKPRSLTGGSGPASGGPDVVGGLLATGAEVGVLVATGVEVAVGTAVAVGGIAVAIEVAVGTGVFVGAFDVDWFGVPPPGRVPPPAG